MSSRPFCIMLLSLSLGACGSDNLADLQEYARQVKERAPGPIEPLPEIERIDTFVFDPASPRDPFVLDRQTAEATATGGGISPDPLRQPEELEQFPLDSLHMVGTLEQGETIWALVKTPEKTLYHVRVGNYMGKNNGQITRITENEIELTEIVSDGTGVWREQPAAIALSE